MQLQVNVSEIKTVYGQQLFNGKSLHMSIYSKTESISGLHQHGYYEFTLVPTGRYYQKINSKRVLLGCEDFVFIPLGSHHQSLYDSDTTRILNVGISKRSFEQHYHPLLLLCFVASQVYRANNSLLTYIEMVIASLNFRKSELDEFIEVTTFCIISRLRHHHEEQVPDDILQRLKTTVETIHDKRQFSENALESMAYPSAKSQGYLTRATQRHYSKTPMQIINGIHINFVKKQLKMTNYPVTGIVYESDYSSPSLSAKTLKKLTSFTLNSYRKKLTELNQQALFVSNPLFMACPR